MKLNSLSSPAFPGKKLAIGSSLLMLGLLFQTVASAAVNVALSPSAFAVTAGATQRVTATVTGSATTTVKWTLQPAVGSISTDGTYTAPAVSAPQIVVITATSVADPTRTAKATATVNPAVTFGTSQGISFRMGTTGMTNLAFQGQSLLCPAKSDPAIAQVSLIDSAGNVTAGAITPKSVATGVGSVTQSYAWGTMTTAYQAVANTLRINVTVQNTTPDKTIAHLWMLPLALQFPSNPVQNPSTNFGFNVDAPSSVYFSYASGAADLVNEDVTKPLALGFWQIENPAASKWFVMLDTDNGHSVNPNWPMVPRPIAPMASDQYTVSIRLGNAGATENQLAGDIFALYARTFPAQLPVYKNKPIASLIVSSRHRPFLPKNPRGWLNDPTIDVTTSAGIAAFQSKLLKWADGAVTEMQRVGAQGAILWDMEGQEYDSAYIGDPGQAEAIAPELVGVMDAFVSKFTSMGFKVGFTLRSQAFSRQTGFLNVAGTNVTWAGGAQFSPAWIGGNNDGSIVIGNTTYQIQSVQSPTSLTLTTSAGAGIALPYVYSVHSDTPDPGAVLRAKIQYAKTRWGASMFYVDTNHSANGTIDAAAYFQTLQNNFPGTMIFPEWKDTRHFAYTVPYNDAANKTFGPPAQTKAVYPQAATVIKVSDPSAAAYAQQLHDSAVNGDILMFDGWYRHPANDLIQQIYTQVH